MSPRSKIVLNVVAISIICGAVALYLRATPSFQQAMVASPTTSVTSSTSAESMPVNFSTSSVATSSSAVATTTPIKKVAAIVVTKKPAATKTASSTVSSAQQSNNTSNDAVRVQNPYSTASESSATVNTDARAALVNIICLSNGSVEPISGSGVIIDPRGVILTNAHVAQYVMLSENPAINLSCTVRTGSPAQATWKAVVLYIPQVWVAQHVSELNTPDPTGTGEHDYALLLITNAVQGGTLPPQFPYLPFDTRQAIGFTGDPVLVASYPAEFLGGLAAENDLYADSSLTNIGSLLTFGTNSVDVISLGGVIEAQTGSSGGAVVNPWGYLIGLITTTSEATTTADRDLRAITLSYINSDIQTQTGSNLSTFMQGDLSDTEQIFNTTILPSLMSQYIAVLQKQGQ